MIDPSYSFRVKGCCRGTVHKGISPAGDTLIMLVMTISSELYINDFPRSSGSVLS